MMEDAEGSKLNFPLLLSVVPFLRDDSFKVTVLLKSGKLRVPIKLDTSMNVFSSISFASSSPWEVMAFKDDSVQDCTGRHFEYAIAATAEAVLVLLDTSVLPRNSEIFPHKIRDPAKKSLLKVFQTIDDDGFALK